jgi:hypothetical protein
VHLPAYYMGRQTDMDSRDIQTARWWVEVGLKYFIAAVLGYIGWDWQTIKTDVRNLREAQIKNQGKLESIDDRISDIRNLLGRSESRARFQRDATQP